MLTIYENRSGALERQKGKPKITEAAVWIDLLNPTPEEEGQIERAARSSMCRRARSSRRSKYRADVYQEDGAHFMTATLMYQPEEGEPRMTPVTFILAGQRLITLRYAEPRAFSIYVARCNRAETDLKSGPAILIGLLETIIDRLADFIERIQAEVEGLSHSIFEIKGGLAVSRQRRFDVLLRAIGREGEITSKARESARSWGGFSLFSSMPPMSGKRSSRCKRASAPPPATSPSVTDHADVSLRQDYLSARCDAWHGQHPTERHHQDVLPIAAVVFLPPTIVASIYSV